MEKKLQLQKERELGEVVSDSFTFIKENFKPLSQLFIKYVLPFLIVILAINAYQLINQVEIFDFVGNTGMVDSNYSVFSEVVVPMLLSSLGIIIISIVLYGFYFSAMLAAMDSYNKFDGEIKMDYVSEQIKKKISSVSLMTIFVGFVLAIGFAMCFIPGIYLWVPFSLTFPILIIKKYSFSEALNECFRLVRENWWRVFGTLLVSTILIILISMIFSLPLIIYTMIESIGAVEANSEEIFSNMNTVPYIIFNLIGTLGSYVCYSFLIIVTGFIYYDLEEKKSFTKTYDEIGEIGNANKTSN
ncbi:MAG: hypothetical protein ACQESK_09885 [Bacteroidota bacterium]